MSCEEIEIYDFLKSRAERFFSIPEISYRLGMRHKCAQDRLWAGPILRRMEIEGWLETNDLGEFRIRGGADHSTCFYKAIEQPGVRLEDTTIITLEDVALDVKPTVAS